MANHIKPEPTVPDPWPDPPTLTVLAVAATGHVLITYAAAIAINALNRSKEANAREQS